MKKFLAFLMAAMMLLSCTAALAEFDEHIDMTLTNRGFLVSGVDYTADEYYTWLSEKFNISIEPWITDGATHNATVSIWINNGDMPDTVELTSFNYDTYREWAEQGLLAPLPEGWEEKYPHILKALQSTMILDYLTVDGQVYGIPAPIYMNFVDMPIPVSHQAIYYRKDWAQELGYEFGDTITLDELTKFCAECIEKDMAGNGNTIGVACKSGHIIPYVMYMKGSNYSNFVKTDDGYVWGPETEGVTEQIQVLRDLYTSGVLYSDFYLADNGYTDRFFSGAAAAMLHDGGPGNHEGAWKDFQEGNPGLNVDEVIDSVVLTDNNGVAHTDECTNFWTIKYFSPDIAPETFDRILSMIDYFNDGAEGQFADYYGIPDVDWKWNEDGLVEINLRPDVVYESPKLVCTWGTCSDELYIKQANRSYPLSMESYLTNMAVKSAGDIIRMDYDYKYYTSETKSMYSVDVNSKIAELVVDSSLDIEAEWTKFIADNEGMWKPLQDELNAEFCGK